MGDKDAGGVLGRSQVGKAAAFEAAMRWFESIRPSMNPVAASVQCF